MFLNAAISLTESSPSVAGLEARRSSAWRHASADAGSARTALKHASSSLGPIADCARLAGSIEYLRSTMARHPRRLGSMNAAPRVACRDARGKTFASARHESSCATALVGQRRPQWPGRSRAREATVAEDLLPRRQISIKGRLRVALPGNGTFAWTVSAPRWGVTISRANRLTSISDRSHEHRFYVFAYADAQSTLK